jgi:hypothetical protein
MRASRQVRFGMIMLGLQAAAGCSAVLGSFDKIDRDPSIGDDAEDGAVDWGAEVDTAFEVAPTPDTGEVLDSIAESPADSDAVGADAAGDTDAGCPLHSHQGADDLRAFYSCLPTGIPTDPTTYTPELLDEQIARAVAAHPGTSGVPTAKSCTGGGTEPCKYVLFDSGTPFYLTWCRTGLLVGRAYRATGTGSVPTCPPTSEPVTWW